MTSFIERKVNEICGRWLDGFTKENVDVSLLQAKITLSDLHFKTDELCLLSPAFAPSVFYVGKLSVDIPLVWNFSRPVKMAVSDVLALVRVGEHESMTPEAMRKSISANVHVKAILNKLAAELGGVGAEEGKRAARINVQTVHNLHKVMRKLEVTIKNAHVRIEEPSREAKRPTAAATDGDAASSPAVAFGVCLRAVSLGLDERAEGDIGGGSTGGQWFGQKFRAMETALLGNYSRYVGALGNLDDKAQSNAHSRAVDARGDRGTNGKDDAKEERTASDESRAPSTLAVTKFASVRGLSAYFCRDDECYSAKDRDETLRRLREGLKSPPTVLPPLLQRCRFGLSLNFELSATEWGKINSMDVRFLAGDINVQLGEDHLGYLLRWSALLESHVRALALSALQPTKDLVAPTRSGNMRGGCNRKSRYYKALWRHAVEVVLRDLRESAWARSESAWRDLQSARAARSETVGRPWSSEQSEYREARGLLWRTWFGEWVRAARYLSLRQLIQPSLVVECFTDESGGIHSKLHEDLDLQPKSPVQKGKARGKGGYSKIVGRVKSKKPASERRLAKYLMPWQLPQDSIDKAWGIINRKTLRWELRHKGGSKLAIDEEEADQELLDPMVLQALWSIQLQLDAQMPHRICAFARRMAILRVGWRSKIDRLWQARAEKQRRLGLGMGEPPTPPRLTPNGSLSYTASEAGLLPLGEAMGDNLTETFVEDVADGDGADRVGTLLVRIGQLNGVGGVGLLSLAPKAVATLMLEESSATLEEMDLETNSTEVAKYDHKNERCCWDQTFRLQVELNEDYVHDLRRQRMRKSRRALTGNSSDGLLDRDNKGISPMGNGEVAPGGDGLVRGVGSMIRDSRTEYATSTSTSTMGRGHSSSPMSDRTPRHRRSDSMDSMRSQIAEAVPLSSFLLAVSCVDKSVFGLTQLGTMTLPGKQLTSVPLKVLEHRCALFSPAAVGRQPRELTLETMFVPPGEDVAHAEQELSAIGRRMRLQEKQDMSKSKSTSSLRRNKDGRGIAPALNASVKPKRSSLENVGEREVKVLSLGPRNNAAGAAGVSNGAAPVTQEDTAKAARDQRSIPVVDTDTPERMSFSIRAGGVTVVVYLNSNVALPRAGLTGMLSQQDVVVTLVEASVRRIEACVEVDVIRGKFALAVDAATLQLMDRSLLQQAEPPRDMLSTGWAKEESTCRPQLMMVGPVSLEITSTRYVREREHMGQRACGDALRNGAEPEVPTTQTSPYNLGRQVMSQEGGRRDNKHDTADGRDQQFWDSLASWPMGDWKGRVKLGAYTAELGKSQDRHSLQEVWRHFRFSLPRSAFEDTQVSRGGTADSSGTSQSSAWLLRIGARSLTVDVQVPKPEVSNITRSPPLETYVYVSSSDESENESLPVSPPSSPSPQLSPDQEGNAPSRLSSSSSRAKVYFPASGEGYGEEIRKMRKAAPRQRTLGTLPEVDHGTGGVGNSVSNFSTATVTATTTTTVTVIDRADRRAAPSNADLVRRVQQLEGELDDLRSAAKYATTANFTLDGATSGEQS